MNRKKIFVLVFVLTLIIISTICIFCAVENSIFATLLSCFLGFFLLLACDYKKNAVMLAFLMCFFVFLLGRPFAYEVIGYSGYTVINMDTETRTFVYICLLVSLVSIIVGFSLSRLMTPKKQHKGENIKRNILDTQVFRSVVKIVTIMFYILAIIENISRFFYIKEVGYTASYTMDIDYGLPFGLHYLVIMAPITFSLFLATLPKKREALIPILLFVISNLLFAASGNRFEIASCLLLVMVYCIWRNDTDDVKWITNKMIICLVILAPVIVITMQSMVYWREGRSVNTEINPIIGFLHGTGGSASIIGAVEELKDSKVLDDDITYSFGGVWKGLNGNIIARLLGISTDYGTSQTVEYAEKAHSLSATLTYYYAPEKYLSGYGLGGCYVAELYHDFSMFGVIVGNLLIGIILGLMESLSKNRVFRNFVCICLLMLFLRLPRDSFDYPITHILSFKNILLFMIIIIISKIINNKQKKTEGGQI